MTRLCAVRGQLIGPDGKPLTGRVRFLANRTGQPIQGALMTPAPVIVSLDARGEFLAHLTPSVVAGEYTLRTPAGSYIVAVPDAPAARLNDIIQWRRGGLL